MANPLKKTLSRNLSQMKFMKRRSLDSQGREEIDSGGVLTEKWIVPNVPSPPTIKSHRVNQLDSFMDCEELNRFGRFSFNNYNKEVERLAQHYGRHGVGREKGEEGEEEEEEEEEGAIPAQEVARRYEAITSKKLLGKRKRGEKEVGRTAHLERRFSEPARHGHTQSGFLRPS